MSQHYTIRIELFGAPTVYRGQESFTRFRTHNAIALIALLVLQRGKPLARELLAEALWPEVDPERQRPRLRYELSLAKEILGSALVRVGNHAVGLADNVRCDIWDFEDACARAERTEACLQIPQLLTAAQIPRDDILPGFYEDSLVIARDQLRHAHHRTLTTLIDRLAEAGELSASASWKEYLQQRYPESGITPLVLPDFPKLSQSFSTPKLSERALHTTLTSERFYGRSDEVRLIRNWLAKGGTSVLTITGPAGIGKTRLVKEAAVDVVFIPLADIFDSTGLFQSLQQALKINDSGEESLETQLIRQLRLSPTVLILDNFEQIVEMGANHIATILMQVPQARFIVTSRSRLEIAGEQELHLTSLPLVEAHNLFLDRARAIRPDFVDDSSVEKICKLLEGLPLALELAAARVLSLDAGQIYEQLKDRFRFLVSRRRDIPERQRSLRAAFEWSMHLLSPPLLESFLRLCVFHGGFTEQAADAVLATKSTAVDVLEALRSHSLILATFHPLERPRYDLLVSLREFGRARAPQTLLEDAQLCHAHYFVARVNEVSGTEGDTLLRKEAENLHAALATLSTQNSEACGRLALSLAGHWERTGQTALARSWFEHCLRIVPEKSSLRGALYERLGMSLHSLAAREKSYEQAIVAYQAAGDSEGWVRLEHALGSTLLARGDARGAKAQFEKCLPLWRELVESGRDDTGLALTLHMLAVSHRRMDAPSDEIWPFLDEAEARLRRSQSPSLGFVLNTRRGIAWESGDIASAKLFGEQIVSLFLQQGKVALAAHIRAWLALPALAEGAGELALSFIAQARQLVEGHEDPPNLVFLWHYGGHVALHCGEHEVAFSDLCYAHELCGLLSNRISALNILRLLGNWHLLARHNAKVAVQLWASVAAMQVPAFARLSVWEQACQDRYWKQAEALLGAEEIARVAAVGRQLSYEAAVELGTAV